jgi:hypothetical protein
MPKLRLLAPILALALVASPARAEDDDWQVVGGALGLLQQIVQVAAHSKDPEAARKHVDAMLDSRNPDANRVAARMMQEMLEDVPAEHRAAILAITRDLLVIARREQAGRPAPRLEIAE